jgi:hypothetical protein
MELFYKTINGKEFPIREIYIGDLFNIGIDYGVVRVADYDMFAEYKDMYNDGDDEICALDNSIFFFCDSGYLQTNPTDEDLRDYLKIHAY